MGEDNFYKSDCMIRNFSKVVKHIRTIGVHVIRYIRIIEFKWKIRVTG